MAKAFRALSVGGLIGAATIAVLSHSESVLQPTGKYDFATSGAALREMVEKVGFMFEPKDQLTLRAAAQDLISAAWHASPSNRSVEEVSISVAQLALARAERVLESADVERIRSLPNTPLVRRLWPSGGGLCIFRIARAQPGETTPAVLRTEVDFAHAPERLKIAVPDAPAVYVLLWGRNALNGQPQLPIEFVSGDKIVGTTTVQIDVPVAGRLELEVCEAHDARATPAVVGVYARDHQLTPSTNALSLDFWQNGSAPVRTRSYATCRWWPGSSWEREVCFVDGSYTAVLPEGEYKIVAAKGPEYEPVIQNVQVKAGETSALKLTLRRWIDMPARGWISGDTHVHFSRRTREDSEPLLTWIAAEDIRVGNVLRMGDANQTSFEQFAFGPEGRVGRGGYWLVTGQEDPRTDELGHVIGLNLLRPIRFPEQYHLYDLVFGQIRAQGGLAGYAHVYQPPRPAFWVRRDMTLNIPKGHINFLEISEFGDIDDRLYFEFLNLGFRLTATGGSDVPWGESVGISRTYAFTGGSTDPDAWFRAVEQGRTFATAGPMLFLEVNGQIAGAELAVQPGAIVRIRAQALGQHANPRYLEIISQGNVIAASNSTKQGAQDILLKTELRIERSTWITARCAGAITSPVYIRVGDEPWWERQTVRETIAARLAQLEEISRLADALDKGREFGYDNPELLRKQLPALRERIETARDQYRSILEKREAAGSSVNRQR